MLTVIQNPVGVDIPIRKMQEHLHGFLMQTWGMDVNVSAENALYQSYGRCYRNRTEKGYQALLFTTGNDYKPAFWNDGLNAMSFFGIGNIISNKINDVVDVHLIFICNLSKLKSGFPNRADEEVRLDVTNFVSAQMYGFEYRSIELGVDNVFKDYPGTLRDAAMKVIDMQPVHCFRLNFILTYNKNKCF
jgi:hypothetical protein